ncbi:MAG TPA: hypothetical protein PLG09_02140 [Syntrophomonadaceae bacterium]|nr:hypothetical protein [Syntrophomonadaceae bacterium]HOQ08906.1 hypothetical protein [Syntrophomonadaceae bacterium]HPU47717.1 hypothetical protein [Syntrophomonadaceae bacterium]
MKVYLNGQEMKYKEGGYEYVFIKPYQKYIEDKVDRPQGQMILQMYDNGVQIRTLITRKEVNTIINRNVAVDEVNRKIYILEPDTQYIREEDGSVRIIE